MVNALARAVQIGASGLQPAARPSSLGGTGTTSFAGRITELEESPDARRDAWLGSFSARGTAAKMHVDAKVRRGHDSISIPIQRAYVDVEPASEDPLHEEHADFVKWALLERLRWGDLARRALLKLRDGVRFFEVTDDVVDLPPGRFPSHPGKTVGIAITGFHDRAPFSIKRTIPRADNDAQLEAVEQWLLGPSSSPGAPRGFVPIPADRILRLTHDQEGGNFWGNPLWRSAMGAWKVKRTLVVLNAIKHERGAVPTPLLELPENANPADIEKAETILAEWNARERGFITLPNGFKLAWSDFGKASNIEEALEYCDREILFPFAAGFLLMGQQLSSPGNYATAYTLEGQHELLIEAQACDLCDALTDGVDGWSPVRRLMDLNYGPQHPSPRVTLRNLPTTNWATAIPAIERLHGFGGFRADDRTRAFFRRALRLPPEDADSLDAPSDGTRPQGRPPVPGAKPQLNPSDPTGVD